MSQCSAHAMPCACSAIFHERLSRLGIKHKSNCNLSWSRTKKLLLGDYTYMTASRALNKAGSHTYMIAHSMIVMNTILRREIAALVTLASHSFQICRAKFIVGSVKALMAKEEGGEQWLQSLRTRPYSEAQKELMQLPGIGPKVPYIHIVVYPELL